MRHTVEPPLWDRLRFSVRIQKVRGHRRLVIHEAHRRAVKLARHGFTLVGLAATFVAFSSVWLAFGVAVVLEVLGAAAGHVFFSYRNLFVHPLPDFPLDTAKWLGMGFGYAYHPTTNVQVPFVAMIVGDPEFAMNLQRMLDAWCYGNRVDTAKHIMASVVRKGPEYFFFLYPSTKRPSAREFFRRAAGRHRGPDSVQDRLFLQLTLAKGFLVTEGSYLPTFARRYSEGVPAIFQVEVHTSPQSQGLRVGENFYVLHTLKIRDYSELTPRDYERAHMRRFGV